MEIIKHIWNHYMWLVLSFVLMSTGGRIYFIIQPLGLTLILTGVMLLLAMENSERINAVPKHKIEHSKFKSLFVHFSTQKSVASFFYMYHFYVYGYLVFFGGFIIIKNNPRFDTILNVLLLVLFAAPVAIIFIRHIVVGTKMEESIEKKDSL